MLEVRDVSVQLGRQTVLSSTSLVVGAGEIVGLVAPNGTGKTTLMRTIAGLYSPRSGSVLIDGIPIQDIPKTRRNKRLFFADVGHCVIPSLTTREHLEYIKAAWGSGVVIEPVIDQLGIGWYLDKRAADLSLGMTQLAAIAMSIVSDADCLVLDEPMNGLDPGNTAEVTRQ